MTDKRETVPCDRCGTPVDVDDEGWDGGHVCAACYWGEPSFAGETPCAGFGCGRPASWVDEDGAVWCEDCASLMRVEGHGVASLTCPGCGGATTADDMYYTEVGPDGIDVAGYMHRGCAPWNRCPWTGADECAMARERAVAGVSDEVPPCPVHSA